MTLLLMEKTGMYCIERSCSFPYLSLIPLNIYMVDSGTDMENSLYLFIDLLYHWTGTTVCHPEKICLVYSLFTLKKTSLYIESEVFLG